MDPHWKQKTNTAAESRIRFTCLSRNKLNLSVSKGQLGGIVSQELHTAMDENILLQSGMGCLCIFIYHSQALRENWVSHKIHKKMCISSPSLPLSGNTISLRITRMGLWPQMKLLQYPLGRFRWISLFKGQNKSERNRNCSQKYSFAEGTSCLLSCFDGSSSAVQPSVTGDLQSTSGGINSTLAESKTTASGTKCLWITSCSQLVPRQKLSLH